MAKANVEIERLIAAAQDAKCVAKENLCLKVEELEIQRQKYLFEAKHECLIEVTDAIVEGVAKAAAIDKGNILPGSLKYKIQNFMDRIKSNIEDIEAMILTNIDSNEAEEGCCNIKNLKYWKACLQNNIDKIIDIYEKPADPSKNISLCHSEYALRQKKIGDEVIAKAHFSQSVKRVEDKSITKFFDKKVREAEDDFTKTLRQINADLAEQIGELLLNPVITEVANINISKENSGNSENVTTPNDESVASPDLNLIGNANLNSDYADII